MKKIKQRIIFFALALVMSLTLISAFPVYAGDDDVGNGVNGPDNL